MIVSTRAFLVVALLPLAVGCAADSPVLPSSDSAPPLLSIAASSSASIEPAARTFRLEVGATAPFAFGARQYERFIRYTSSNPSVAVASGGVISALSEGTAIITGALGGTQQIVDVTVVPSSKEPPTVSTFRISPKFGAAVDLGGVQKFSTTAEWSDNMQRPVEATFSATGGTVTAMGSYSAGQVAGVFMVVAHCVCGVADTAFVRVGAVPAQLATLKISPKTVTLAPGATQVFSSTVTWSTGDTTPPPRSYFATGGTITTTGSYKAPSTAGTYRVIVAHTGGTLRDTAVVTVGTTGSNPETPPPNTGPFGPGPNAPNWAGKRSYPVELFAAPIPFGDSPSNAAGFRGVEGFDDRPNSPSRATYPTVSTPIGTKQVMQVTYPGSTKNISGTNQSTEAWPANREWAVNVSGTWNGTLIFELSTDNGVSWNNMWQQGTMNAAGGQTESGTSTTVNGRWRHENPIPGASLFRVRAGSWTSGVATVSVGMRGGGSPIRMGAGSFDGAPKRIYTRVLVYVDPNWSNGGNTGTKFFQFSQQQGNNHYVGIVPEGTNGFSSPSIFLQGPTYRNMMAAGPPLGGWYDIEYVFIANDAGVPNGIAQSWVNGKQYVNESDVLHFGSGKTAGFHGLFMDPTYGGGHAPPPRNIFIQIAGWYRESAP